MAAIAGIAWISTNLLDVQRVRQVHHHLSLSGEGRATFLGVVTTGCSPLPVGGHLQVAHASAPRFTLLHHERSEQAHGRLAVGAAADDALAALDVAQMMDVAQRTDGVWQIVELGDGQVAGLPPRADPAAFYATLAGRLNDSSNAPGRP